ncbi:hypothetical protein SAMN04488009_0513 [Maribacter sedimenticola]|uniref:Membrane or secreted protein n=1 Tax=Maribacter sedimenticola TaxID=228956 RepID=A0ABY1SD60_9FLAO|nr:hypothetical protein [Maribacter sedimenticola]SNR26508.1 hypothetical protein SAMN04488009_0513 [Maribacter sedimenticola]
MKNNKHTPFWLIIMLFLSISLGVYGQIMPGVYTDTVETNGVKKVHQVKIFNDYFVYNEYEITPATFIKTLGGFVDYEMTGSEKQILLRLEFNSDYNKDAQTQLSIPYTIDGKNLKLYWTENLTLKPTANSNQELDGAWLFATRGPDNGQERRGESNTRKTLKLLTNGTFQWIAYDTQSFRFSGTGGGTYGAKDGIYTEQIEFFSKDDTRVGATLNFNYNLKDDDWHHTGKNSKGEPMYEIWGKRR